MLNLVDNFLNKITMYRLVLFYLIGLVAWAFVLSVFGKLPFAPWFLLMSTAIICIVSWAANELFAKVFEAPANKESVWITALILVLIISPAKTFTESATFILLGWASILAMGSKYILAIGKKHVFNPAAIAVVITGYAIGGSASWWVGTLFMLPAVLIGGVLMVRKIQRWDLVLSFFGFAAVSIIISSLLKGNSTNLATRVIEDTPLFFFAFVMLTEPLTTPPDKWRRILYGATVGVLFNPNLHVANIYFTPELALVVGNLASYLISPKHKYILKLKDRVRIGKDAADFIFKTDKPAQFSPGQYLEWTLAHDNSDNRGNRRYFTIASSPTEQDMRLGVKFYQNGSSYKKALLQLQEGEIVVASQLAGDFVMPQDKQKKLAFIAGGIGITPFRSMVKYLTDRNEKRDVALFYSNKTADEISYKDVFDEAGKKIGMKTFYTLTDKTQLPANWNGGVGKLTPQIISSQIPDFQQRMFFLSGPRSMVVAFEQTLKQMGVPNSHVKIDFFPGFA